ncbi:hypothetical protein B484DRAFT_407673, partial [Ochromonadaceae sp. CCMP2298]
MLLALLAALLIDLEYGSETPRESPASQASHASPERLVPVPVRTRTPAVETVAENAASSGSASPSTMSPPIWAVANEQAPADGRALSSLGHSDDDHHHHHHHSDDSSSSDSSSSSSTDSSDSSSDDSSSSDSSSSS